MARSNYDQDKAFWEKYSRGRPSVPDSFFQHIFDYHAEHNGSFGTVHDAGAGGGIHTSRLVGKFDRVLVSDVGSSNVDVAKQRFGNASNCQFRVAKFEDVDGIEKGSIDMLLGLNMIHFTDLEKAAEAAAYQLKPGGTLVLATFAYPVLFDEAAQKIWSSIFRAGAEELIERRGELENEGHRVGRQVLRTDLDVVPVPSKDFLPGVLRLKINYPPGYSYADMLVPQKYLKEYYSSLPSQVSPDDRCENRTDDNWRFEPNLERLKNLFRSHPLKEDLDSIQDSWKKMEELVGDKTVPAAWAVNMIMATRR